VFINKGRDKIKLLIWHRNGFWVLYKRLPKQRFKWPDWFSADSLVLSQDQLDCDRKQRHRVEHARPLWDSFIAWANKKLAEGVAHAGTLDALKYLVRHADGLRGYCDDGRLPISNIQSEHVAKTIAVSRKNFLFADTPAGARSSALNYSLIETVRANGHHPQRYLSVLLTELPKLTNIDAIEALLPSNIMPAEVARRYALYPAP